jgi:glutathionylspermidine amidase/synthetase
MPSSVTKQAAPFGTVIGLAPGNVPVYSSDYKTASDDEVPTRQAYRSYVDNVYMGHKWQCVEFARRWLYVNCGYVFDDIAMAYDIFRLTTVRLVRDNKLLPLRSFRNGSKRHPEKGCLLIWDEGGEFETTGHVAIVTEVTSEYLRIAEQNLGHCIWPDGQGYARQLNASVTDDGEYWVESQFGDATILAGSSKPTTARMRSASQRLTRACSTSKRVLSLPQPIAKDLHGSMSLMPMKPLMSR